ncbi:MAG: SagB/ThcOx family dehydrogenase [Clostridiales bacterium]|nr:SagB/ThcOx family dehydrogenase [Clostridiales bacterium]
MKYGVAKSNWGFRNIITDQAKGVQMPPFEKPFDRSSKLINLVPHGKIKLGESKVYQIMVKRRSRRKFKNEALTLEELSYLLLSTQGIINPNKPRFRTVPSGGARHGFETYLYIERVEDLEVGLYRYLPVEHKLLYLGKRNKENLTYALAGQNFKPAVTFIWTVVPYRIAWRYAGAEEKLMLLDVGHVCQNLYIACEAEGMGTCAIGAYMQELLDEFLGIDGEHEFSIYAAPVGKI